MSREENLDEHLTRLLKEAEAKFISTFTSEAASRVEIKVGEDDQGWGLRFHPVTGFTITTPDGGCSSLFAAKPSVRVRAAQEIQSLWNTCKDAEVKVTVPTKEAIRAVELFLSVVKTETQPTKET